MSWPANPWMCKKFTSSDSRINTTPSKTPKNDVSSILYGFTEKLAFSRQALDDLGRVFWNLPKRLPDRRRSDEVRPGFEILKRNNRRRRTRKIVDGCVLRTADTFAVAPREKSSPDNGCETHNGNRQLPIGLSSSISSRSHHQPLQPPIPRTSPGDLRCESSSSTNTMRNYLAITLSRFVLFARRNRFYFIRFYCWETDVAWPFTTAFSNTHYKMG